MKLVLRSQQQGNLVAATMVQLHTYLGLTPRRGVTSLDARRTPICISPLEGPEAAAGATTRLHSALIGPKHFGSVRDAIKAQRALQTVHTSVRNTIVGS